MLINPGSRLVMTGDSITDCERSYPVGEKDGLGRGYVSLVNALLAATYPAQHIRVFNTGVGGNTVRNLAERWDRDVLDLRPDWVSVMIGINDVWRQFDSPLQSERHVPPAEYEATLNRLLEHTRPRIQGLVLMTPYLIEPNRDEPMRAMMDCYGAIVRQAAQRFEAIFVDTQAAFDAALTTMHPMSLALDRVHPNLTGHAILARAFLDATGYAWKSNQA